MDDVKGEFKIIIIILTMNQRERTLSCLSSLYAMQSSSYDVLLWDNGSTDGTQDAVKSRFPQVTVHHSDTNLGVASGRNAAAQLAIQRFDPTHLLFLDNDMLFEPGFVGALLAPFTSDEMVGQTQAKLLFMDDKKRLNDAGGARINFTLWQVSPVGYGEIDYGQYDTMKPCTACGGAMMVRSDIFQEFGGFDPIFDPFGPEDLDFSLRLQKAGYIALYVPQAVAYHAVSHSFGRGYNEEYARHKSRHWLIFMRRHASPWQKLKFYTIGVPYLVMRVFTREVKRGNLRAFRGLLRGVFDN